MQVIPTFNILSSEKVAPILFPPQDFLSDHCATINGGGTYFLDYCAASSVKKSVGRRHFSWPQVFYEIQIASPLPRKTAMVIGQIQNVGTYKKDTARLSFPKGERQKSRREKVGLDFATPPSIGIRSQVRSNFDRWIVCLLLTFHHQHLGWQSIECQNHLPLPPGNY